VFSNGFGLRQDCHNVVPTSPLQLAKELLA